MMPGPRAACSPAGHPSILWVSNFLPHPSPGPRPSSLGTLWQPPKWLCTSGPGTWSQQTTARNHVQPRAYFYGPGTKNMFGFLNGR